MGNLWSDPSAVLIQTGTQSGSAPVSFTTTLPRSDNQKEGAVFSFEGWFVVNDYTTTGYGSRRMIFSRGDCPGLYIDSTSNSILVVVDTYGASETIMIQNIPAQKWVHFGIVVSQYAVDIYINGILRQHHTLNQLPKQEDAAVQIAQKPFDGQVGGLTYYPRALTAAEVNTRASGYPPPSLVTAPESGHYFDISWYTG
jgi:hypothetical protein